MTIERDEEHVWRYASRSSFSIESEGAHILNSFVTKEPINDKISLTLKVDKLEVSAIVATLERMSYEVNASYQEKEYYNNLQDRYDALMHYLNI